MATLCLYQSEGGVIVLQRLHLRFKVGVNALEIYRKSQKMLHTSRVGAGFKSLVGVSTLVCEWCLRLDGYFELT